MTNTAGFLSSALGDVEKCTDNITIYNLGFVSNLGCEGLACLSIYSLQWYAMASSHMGGLVAISVDIDWNLTWRHVKRVGSLWL